MEQVTSMENSENICDVPGGHMHGTLSISLRCTCDVPARYTGPCPQCEEFYIVKQPRWWQALPVCWVRHEGRGFAGYRPAKSQVSGRVQRRKRVVRTGC